MFLCSLMAANIFLVSDLPNLILNISSFRVCLFERDMVGLYAHVCYYKKKNYSALEPGQTMNG